jgi:glycosyltransferase involved in cell wall biosynthesis
MKKNRLVFMNSGMHFWNRETEILAGLNKEYEILLIISHSENKNYVLNDILSFCSLKKISLIILDNTARRAINLNNFTRAINTLKKIKEFKPDIIYLETFNDPYLAILCVLFLNKLRVIISIMDYELHPYEQNSIRLSDKFYQIIYLKFFQNFQLFSAQQASLMKNNHPSKNIFHIPLFLIKNDYRISNNNNKGEQKFINFLFLGKIYYYKGLDILIDAGNVISSRYTNIKFTIAGDCKDFKEYENRIINKDVFELKISYLPKDEIQELMMKADVLVLPYRQVTQSGPLMMAFNFGIIPLASDLMGFQELIKNGYNGFLFKNNSVDELVKIMEKIILMTKFDREIIRENLVKYVVENYNVCNFVNRYKLMFSSISGNK